MPRLFVAALPDDVTRAALAALPRPEEPGVRWVPPEQWHVTLRFLGDADPVAVARALDAHRLPRATAELGPVVSRFGRSTVVLPVAGLDELAAAVRAATAEIGPPPDPRPFTGHLTLARLRHRAACGVAGTRCRARFEVHEVVLVDSELRPEGAVHRTVHRVPTVTTGDLTNDGGAPRTPPSPPPR
jgi:2'-5' RNA ligase